MQQICTKHPQSNFACTCKNCISESMANIDKLFNTEDHKPTPENRKATPIFSGVLMYFPKAIAEIAKCSFKANEQHNPGTKMHWDRSKSGDELDALTRHLMEAGTIDTDGIRHSTKIAWRALANLQKELEDIENFYNDEIEQGNLKTTKSKKNKSRKTLIK